MGYNNWHPTNHKPRLKNTLNRYEQNSKVYFPHNPLGEKPEYIFHADEYLSSFMAYLAQHFMDSCKSKGMALPAMEKYFLSNGIKITRGSLYGLIRNDRGDFRLSYFVRPYKLLDIDFNEVLMGWLQVNGYEVSKKIEDSK